MRLLLYKVIQCTLLHILAGKMVMYALVHVVSQFTHKDVT